MGVVITCPKCGHTSQHGPYIDRLDPRFKSTDLSQAPRIKCQVPVQHRFPNNPGIVESVPCGCIGPDDPIQRSIVKPTIVAPPPKCLNPDCPGQEFAAPNSSFCSVQCQDEMMAIIAGAVKGADRGNQDQSSEQGEVAQAPGSSAGTEDSRVEVGEGTQLEGREPAQGSPVRGEREVVQAQITPEDFFGLPKPPIALPAAPADCEHEFNLSPNGDKRYPCLNCTAVLTHTGIEIE